MNFAAFFESATGAAPYDYQTELAGLPLASRAVRVPAGAGKTAAAVLAWLWNRCAEGRTPPNHPWPTRLVYCLPERALVEPTCREAGRWLANLNGRGGLIDAKVAPFTLAGGTPEEGWERHPERPAILIGTQDVLLSRALNRGYAVSRYRWPLHFALLNNDCLWVCDEVQLMGPAFETTLQFDAFRPHRWRTCGPTATWWMSAALDEKGFETTDRLGIARRLRTPLLADTSTVETAVAADGRLAGRLRAAKRVGLTTGPPKPAEVVEGHRPGSLTLVILNTVKGAAAFHAALMNDRALKGPAKKNTPGGAGGGEVLLLHSQFRPPERRAAVERLLQFEADRRDGKAPEAGLILVTSQVVEAGLDVSARRLWSQVAPWASVVQRLGRLNRDGQSPDAEAVFWLETNGRGEPKEYRPYEPEDLMAARGRLGVLEKDGRNGTEGFGEALRAFPAERRPEVVIRPPDVWELFDTDPDPHGGFTDVSRYVRGADREAHAYVLWRGFDPRAVQGQPGPGRDELCRVPFYDLAAFLGSAGAGAAGSPWLYQPGDGPVWEPIAPRKIRAGMTVLLHRGVGGYDRDRGWTGTAGGAFDALTGGEQDTLPAEGSSLGGRWETIAEHTHKVYRELETLLSGVAHLSLPGGAIQALRRAARWHDRGKAHPRWQQGIEAYGTRARLPPPPQRDPLAFWAKAPDASFSPLVQGPAGEERANAIRGLRATFRPGLRHESASALAARRAWLDRPTSGLTALAVYLVAAHHGKVRSTLRPPLTGGGTPDGDRAPRSAFGLSEGDAPLPETDLGGERAGEYAADLECMEVGLIERDGREEPSWLQMVADLLGPCDPAWAARPFRHDGPDEVYGLGPFRLALLETLLRVADWRASAP